MKDYIERDLMLKQAGNLPIPLSLDEVRLLRRVINSLPAANVRENVRGEWVIDGALTKCNQCGEEVFPHWNFCPNCGVCILCGRMRWQQRICRIKSTQLLNQISWSCVHQKVIECYEENCD